MLVVNSSNHDVDLDGGYMLPPGERATIERSDRHRELILAGLLTPTEEPAATLAPADPNPVGVGSPQAPPAQLADVPAEPVKADPAPVQIPPAAPVAAPVSAPPAVTQTVPAPAGTPVTVAAPPAPAPATPQES